MPRKCTICEHKHRKKIDKALVDGVSYRDIAGRFNVSRTTLSRHKKEHLPRNLARGKKAKEAAEADGLLDHAKGLLDKANEILAKTEKKKDWPTALKAIREARGVLELLAKLEGQIREGIQVNVLLQPSWIKLRTAILAALDKHPKAKRSVVAALKEVEDDGI